MRCQIKNQRTHWNLAWKNSLENMANDAISNLVSDSIKRGLIKDEKEPTVTSLRHKEFGKNVLGHTLFLPKGYGRYLYTHNVND